MLHPIGSLPLSLLLVTLVVAHYSCTHESSSPPDETTAKVAGATPAGINVERLELPPGAPAWLGTRVQTSQENGQRLLRATGLVFGIQDRHLAINAASARALHELSRWLQVDSLRGLEITQKSFSPNPSWAAAMAQVPLPKEWSPPEPAPESKLP